MHSTLKLLVATAALAFANHAAAQTFAVRGARVFDGERVIPSANVVVRDGRIASVGADAAIPSGIEVIDGAGRTLLPGLLDAHTHSFTPEVLEAALSFGVTTVLDMFTAPDMAATWKAEQANGANGRADIFSAGVLVTPPRGHGTQFGMPIPTLTRPEDADAYVAARIAEGSDWIKLVHDDGRVYGFDPIPTLDSATIAAVAQAAHARGRKVVAHVGTLAGARRVIGAGVDGLVHLWVDSVPSPAFVAEMRRRGTFVVPTATVYEGFGANGVGEPVVADERTAPWLGPEERTNLRGGLQARPNADASFDALMRSLRVLADAGVPLLVGSDAPNPGTTHGASVHRELELFVRAGVSPVEALRAATSVTADAFGLEGRGRIAPGMRADLVMVEGDPTTNITDARAVTAVFKGGVRYDRGARRDVIAGRVAAANAPVAAVEIPEGGLLVSGFDEGTASVAIGAGWGTTNDGMMGGKSTAQQEVVEGGAAGTAHSLRVHGEIASGLPFAWAGTMVFPGAQPMAPVDLSGASGFAFHARGGPGEWRVMLFTRSGGQIPATVAFTPGDAWAEYTFAWSDFNGANGADVMGIAITAGPAPGPYEIRIDELRLVR